MCTRISPASTLCRECLETYYDELKISEQKLQERVYKLEQFILFEGFELTDIDILLNQYGYNLD